MATIAIVGGGFCGIEVARHLKGHDVTLFDRKDYFEYTPSTHKMLANNSYEKKIHIPYSKFKVKLVKEEVKSITANSVVTENDSYGFDYLVLCSGSSTEKPAHENVYTLKNGEDAKAISKALESAEEVTIVGGWFTGVEIAGELATKTKKRVRLLNGSARLMDRANKEVGERAADFLHKNGVQILFNKKVDHAGEGLVIWCIGITPNTSTLNFPKDSRGFILVEKTLQVKGTINVFAGGDIIDVKEEKSAQNAEIHGKLIAKNIERLAAGRSLKEYKPETRAMLVSMGDNYSIFCYGNHVFDGLIPAVMKNVLEIMTTTRYRL